MTEHAGIRSTLSDSLRRNGVNFKRCDGTRLALLIRVENPEPTPVVVVSSRPRPAQDEWGLFDPEQAGFEAVMRKLSALRVSNPPPVKGRANSK